MKNNQLEKLSDYADYSKAKISIAEIDTKCYFSTENMLPNKGGVTEAAGLPTQDNVTKVLPENVLVSNIRPYFKKIYFANELAGASNDVLCFVAKNGCLPRYLYYLLSSDSFFDYMMAGAKGTKMPRGDKGQIMNFPVWVPEQKEQSRIVSVLSALDEKIENISKINHNLLKEALTLYAAHFASQDKNGCIGDYCSVRSGFAFKSSWWVDKGVKVIKIGSISQDNLNLLECSHVDEDKIEKASDFKVGAGDLLIAMTGATIGKFTMVPHCSETLLVNQRVGKFFLGNNPVEKLPFIYCTLKQPDIYNEIVNRGQGSAQPNISAIDIMNIPCVIPSIDNLTTFNNTCQPLFDLIISNQRESQQLSEIRDSLLPKLMSGEIDVSEVEV